MTTLKRKIQKEFLLLEEQWFQHSLVAYSMPTWLKIVVIRWQPHAWSNFHILHTCPPSYGLCKNIGIQSTFNDPLSTHALTFCMQVKQAIPHKGIRAPSAPFGGGRATTFCGQEKQHILHMQLHLLQHWWWRQSFEKNLGNGSQTSQTW